ncbi:unnamed protein product, partial [Polarella glacialis]
LGSAVRTGDRRPAASRAPGCRAEAWVGRYYHVNAGASQSKWTWNRIKGHEGQCRQASNDLHQSIYTQTIPDIDDVSHCVDRSKSSNNNNNTNNTIIKPSD